MRELKMIALASGIFLIFINIDPNALINKSILQLLIVNLG